MYSSLPNTPPLLPCPLPSHPRLLVSDADWTRIRKNLETDPPSARIFASLLHKAEEFLSSPPSERIQTGYRLLYVSRQALERVTTLSVVFCVSGDPRFARRAIAELQAVCRFTDWNPSHFLDTAEMALAVAIGYDWLHTQLTPEDRDLISQALLEKGIRPSLKEPKQWFISGNNNWNQVCHAGMVAAAVAIADREPEIAEQILRRAVDNLHYSAEAYAPDGAYPEGPMYWNYGTSFHVVLAAALERFTGSTQGVDEYPGFAASADYVLQVTTPTGHFYPYADCRLTRHMLIPLFWFARRFQRPDWVAPDLAALETHLDVYDKNDYDDSNYRLLALSLIWREPALSPAPNTTPSTSWCGQGPNPVAAFRARFDDPNALYAAIKGGSPSGNHAHMDSGSFMIQADGVVWATDLGMQDYESLESIQVNLWDQKEEGDRWKIFRLGPESHNILRFNQSRQKVEGTSHFVQFSQEKSNPHAVLDLTPLYSSQVTSARRGLMLFENRAVLLQDEWTAKNQALEVVWQMLTPAEISLQSGEIHLSQAGKKMVLHLLDSPEATVSFQETESLQQTFDTPNPGIKRITITISVPAGKKGVLRVLAIPGSSAPLPVPSFRSLSSWSEPLS